MRRTGPASPMAGSMLATLVALCGFVGFLASSPAQAAPFVDVTYDLGDSTAISTIPVLSATATIPPGGTIAGSQTIRYVSDSATAPPGLATGAAELLTFNLYVHATGVGYSVYTHTAGSGVGKTFITVATSDLHIEFLSAGAVGQRLAGGTVTAAGAIGKFRVTGYQHCVNPPGCQVVGVTPTVTLPIYPDTFTAPLPTLTGAIGPSYTVRGTATGVNFYVRPIGANFPIGVTGTTFIVGREVSRTPVPEPGSLPLAAVGLVALGVASMIVRRRMCS